jgi:hypothetical protein
LFGSQFLSFPSLGLQPAPIEFSLPIFILVPLFHAGFSRWRLVPREPILGLSAELLALPSLISLDPDLSPVHASLVPWSEWLLILFVCADPIWILCLIIFFRPVPRTRFCIHVSPLMDFLLTLLAVVSRARSICFQWSTRDVLSVLQKGQFWCRFPVDFGVDCCRISSRSILELPNRKDRGFMA